MVTASACVNRTHRAVCLRSLTVLCVYVHSPCCVYTFTHRAVCIRSLTVLCVYVHSPCCMYTFTHRAVCICSLTMLCVYVHSPCCVYMFTHRAVCIRSFTVHAFNLTRCCYWFKLKGHCTLTRHSPVEKALHSY